jgi:hypothetical protein
VLQDLVGVDHIETAVVELEGIDIPDGRGQVRQPALVGQAFHLTQDGRLPLERDHLARRHLGGEIDGDGARPAADVEQALVGAQPRDEVGRGVGGRTRSMR